MYLCQASLEQSLAVAHLWSMVWFSVFLCRRSVRELWLHGESARGLALPQKTQKRSPEQKQTIHELPHTNQPMNNTSTVTPSQTAHRAQVVSKGTLIHPIPLACNDKATATAKHHQTAHSASTLQPACIPSVTQNAYHWPARYRRGRNEAPPSTGRAQR